jgi:hypothetical protein
VDVLGVAEVVSIPFRRETAKAARMYAASTAHIRTARLVARNNADSVGSGHTEPVGTTTLEVLIVRFIGFMEPLVRASIVLLDISYCSPALPGPGKRGAVVSCARYVAPSIYSLLWLILIPTSRSAQTRLIALVRSK